MAYDIKLDGGNKIVAEKMLKDIIMICDECDINYWLEGGTLLGIYREDRLLPWDNDIDISVKSNEEVKFKKLFSLLSKHNYRVRLRHFEKDCYPFKKDKIRIIKIREKKFFGLIKGSVCFEIFVKYSLSKLVKRDTKGLYKLALSNKIKNLIGYNSKIKYKYLFHKILIVNTGSTNSKNL